MMGLQKAPSTAWIFHTRRRQNHPFAGSIWSDNNNLIYLYSLGGNPNLLSFILGLHEKSRIDCFQFDTKQTKDE